MLYSETDGITVNILSFLRSLTFVSTIVTIPIYLILLFAFIKHRTFLNSSFFTICVSVGVSDIWWTLHKSVPTLIYKLFNGPVFAGSMVLATYTHMGNWYIYATGVLGVLILAISRFTAMMKPTRHQWIWRKRNVKLAIALQWLLPLPTVVPMFFPCCISYYHNETMYPIFVNREVEEIYFKADVIIELMIISPALIILYMFIYHRIWKQLHSVAAQKSYTHGHDSTNTRNRKHINSAVIGGLISGTYLMYMVSWCYAELNDWSLPTTLWFFIVNDLFICLNPYLLIGFCRKARKAFLNVATCGKIHIE